MKPPGDSLVNQEHQRLVVLRMQLLEMHPFWGFLLLPMQFVPAPLQVPMTTDYLQKIWYDPECTHQLNFKKLGYVLLHQVCHLAFATLGRQNRRIPLLWHQATDYAINRVIESLCNATRESPYENPTTLIQGNPCFEPLQDPRFHNFPAESIYEILAGELEENAPDDGDIESKGEPEGSRTDGPKKDSGDTGDEKNQEGAGAGEVDEGVQDGDEKINDSNNSESQNNSGSGGGNLPPFYDWVVPHGSGIDVHLRVPEDEAFREKLQERLVDAWVRWEQSGSRGTVPLEIERLVERARGFSVNWRRLFHQFVDPCLGLDELSLSRPNRRWLMEDILVPGPMAEKIPFLVVSVDTSGSMSEEFLSEVFQELKTLSDLAQECLLMVCDAKIHDKVPTDRLEEFFRNRILRGGGGTSHVPVFKALERIRQIPSLFIGISDLYSRFPNRPPPCPVLWLVPPVHGQVPFGTKVVCYACNSR